MYPSYEDIISNIKAIMAEKGMKQVAVAERSGFTPQEFSHLLNDRRKLLRIEHMPVIADALGVSLEKLFGIPELSVEMQDIKKLLLELKRNQEQYMEYVKRKTSEQDIRRYPIRPL